MMPRLRVGYTAGGGGGGGETVALAYTSNGGATLASNGIPLKPGLLTVAQINAGRGVLYNNGSEVAVFIKPLKGVHADASCRALLLQVAVSDVSSGTLTFDTSATRVVSPLSETTITGSNVTSHARVLPSSAAYLCETRCTFQPLLPEASYDSECNGLYVTHFNDRYSVQEGYSPAQRDLSTYEYLRALEAKWCVTGTVTYWNKALERGVVRVQNATPASTGDVYATINPEPITGSTGDGPDYNGRQTESHTQCMVGLAVLYHLTGWEQFRLVQAHWGQWRMAGTDTRVKAKSLTTNGTGWIQTGNNVRANLKQMWAACCQILVEKNIAVTGAYGTGRVCTFVDEIDWMLDAINTNVWASGGWRNGIPFDTGDSDNTGQGAPAVGDTPVFQLGLAGDMLNFLRYNIVDDARIEPLQKKVADILISHTAALQSSDVAFGVAGYGYDYWLTATADGRGNGNRTPWTMPTHASTFGWVYCDTADSQYLTALDRCIDADNVATSHLTQGADGTGAKIFGETFGNQMETPFLRKGTLPTGLRSTVYEPT